MLLPLLFFITTSIGHPPPESTLALFPQSSFRTLHVFSCNSAYPSDREFSGIPLPSEEYARTYRGNKEDFEGYYALTRFPYSKKLTAYLVRQPSQYESSLVVMYLYSNKTNRAIAHIDLADEFGDGLWFFERNAWLIRHGNAYRVVIKELNSSQEESDPDKGDRVWCEELSFVKGAFQEVRPSGNAPCQKYKLKHTEHLARAAVIVGAP